ncbi:MAG: phosphohydrolase [Patescibacteria group bacterium]|nr:phosphohydrolase [Patescibacteria group bacterium]MDD4611001.1 phosphohydrolase [Patescibacteria group bacterium]
MENLGINYNKAKELVAEYTKDRINNLHYLETEAIMRALARHFNENEEEWAIIGLLHYIDWELTKDDTKNHCLKAVEILKNAGGSDFLIKTIQSHCYGQGWGEGKFYGPEELKDKKREGLLEHCLAAAETATGLIVASTLVQPEKKLALLKLESLKKKFKNKKFAANCNREIIKECEQVGLSLEEFLHIGLESLRGISDQLGL